MDRIPKAVKLVYCRNQCGVVFCGAECEASHHDDDRHYIACPYIKQARGLIVPTATFCRPEHKVENAEKKRESEETMSANLAIPAFLFIPYGAQMRRFRPGQRVECKMGDGRWVPGTVTSLHFQSQGGGPLAAYGIKPDNGRSCGASFDSENCIRRIPGYKLVRSMFEPSPQVARFAFEQIRACGLITLPGVKLEFLRSSVELAAVRFGAPNVVAVGPAFSTGMCSECERFTHKLLAFMSFLFLIL